MTAIRVTIDMTACDGHGICALLAPEVFDIDRYGYAELLERDVDDGEAKRVRRAAKACPERAIHIEEQIRRGCSTEAL